MRPMACSVDLIHSSSRIFLKFDTSSVNVIFLFTVAAILFLHGFERAQVEQHERVSKPPIYNAASQTLGLQ